MENERVAKTSLLWRVRFTLLVRQSPNHKTKKKKKNPISVTKHHERLIGNNKITRHQILVQRNKP